MELLAQDIVGVSCDHVLLIGSYDYDLDTAIGGADDLALSTEGLAIELLIHLDTEELKSRAYIGA